MYGWNKVPPNPYEFRMDILNLKEEEFNEA